MTNFELDVRSDRPEDQSSLDKVNPLQADALNVTELQKFLSKTFGDRDLSLSTLSHYKAKSLEEQKTITQLAINFDAIAELNNDQWGAETKITNKDISVLKEKGMPSAVQRVENASSWGSLNKAVEADPDYAENLKVAEKIQSAYRKYRNEVDANNDKEISRGELNKFSKRDDLDVGAKQMVKFMQDNFESLSYGSKTVANKTMSEIGSSFSPRYEKLNAWVGGATASLEIGAFSTLGAMGTIFVAVEGLAAIAPSLEIMPPPVSVPAGIGLGIALGSMVLIDNITFDSYKSSYGKRMTQFSKARR